MQNKIAVVSFNNCVEIFSIVGAEVFIVKNKNEVVNLLSKLVKENFNLIFINDLLFKQLQTEIKQYDSNLNVIIASIPN